MARKAAAPFLSGGHAQSWLQRALICALLCCLGVGAALAQDKKRDPAWRELTPEQQQILAPLATQWDRLEPVFRTRWLGVAERYPKMSPTEQKRMQSRMTKWAKLSPEQRKRARENYRRLKEREDLVEKWEEYQALPPMQRQSLLPEAGELQTAPPPRSEPRRRAPRTGEAPAQGR